MGGEYIDSQTRVQTIDTFRVDLSTVLIDSLITSSTKTALIGSYSDNVFGSVRCESYFDFAYQEFPDIEEKAIFDSAALILLYSSYSYGDTTSLLTLNIHKLSEKIVPFATTSYLYNNSKFDYEQETLSSSTFYPTPNSPSDTSVVFPLNSLGEEMFTLIKNNDQSMSSEEWFTDYLKGFVITSESPENRSVLAFTADKDHLKLKIYYHIDKEEPDKKEITITMGQESHQFNNVAYDLTGTPVDGIKNTKNEMMSYMSGNMSFMQGLTGLIAKVRFPTVQDLLAIRRWKIIRAELILEPVKGSFEKSELPDKMYIYDTDRENRILSILKDSQGNMLTAYFEYDDIYGEDTRYTYDITEFIINEFSDSYFDYNHGLMLGLNQDIFRTTFDRLQIQGKTPPVKLKIYFLTY
jgi:hypothetical protein